MRVAITGGIGEGKSTVLGYLRDAGYPTTSADAVARELVEHEELQAELARLAGLETPLDRNELRQKLAVSPELRRSVNAVLHPRIRAALRSFGEGFLEIPLLIETCSYGEYDRVWVVTCSASERRRRLIERYGSPEEAERLAATQLPTRAKIPFADLVIRTNVEPEAVRRFVCAAASQTFSGEMAQEE